MKKKVNILKIKTQKTEQKQRTMYIQKVRRIGHIWVKDIRKSRVKQTESEKYQEKSTALIRNGMFLLSLWMNNFK